MKTFILSCIAAAAAASDVILVPKETASKHVAVVWIHGMRCPNEQYITMATALQAAGHEMGQNIWVGIPEFIFDAPEPFLIDNYVEKAIEGIRKAGFTGDNIMLAAHSLGGVMAQRYAEANSDLIKGQILMGSVLTRGHHTLNPDGSTHFDYPVPTLTLGGTKDGLMRITRMAEAYYHQIENIEAAQAGVYPVFALEGASHMSFMAGTPPGLVMKRDLRAEVPENEAHAIFGEQIALFIDKITGGESIIDETSTGEIVAPLIEAMKEEGSHAIAPPCNDGPLINRTSDPTCLHGSPFNKHFTQNLMGGKFGNPFINVDNDDNFHPVWQVNPVHLPEIDSTCKFDVKKECQINTVTVSQNHYDFLDRFDTGYYPISAKEIKTKINSRQSIQGSAGIDVKYAFHTLDEVGNRCAEINDFAIDWAYKRLSPAAKQRYDDMGMKMVTGDDNGPYNAGPLWIWKFMEYDESEDKSTLTVHSAMMRTPIDYFVESAAGFHYCKVLSPFRAMEHMYIDSLFYSDGVYNDYQVENDFDFSAIEAFLQ